MIKIDMSSEDPRVTKRANFDLAMRFVNALYTGSERHGRIKHIRDNKRAWMKRLA